MAGSEVTERALSRRRWRVLGLLSLSTLLALSLWFSTNAIAPALQREKGLSADDLAWLTIVVQLGFVAGTLVRAVLNLADLVNARLLFGVSAVAGALLNLGVIPAEGFFSLLLVRFGTGVLLAGV